MRRLLLGAALAALLVPCARAELLARKDLSLATSLAIASAAIESCRAGGFKVSAAVVGREGQVLVQLRGDDTGPHTMENAYRKAFTARSFRIPSGEVVERLKQNPQLSWVHLANVIAAQGALPVTVGGDVIGAIGVSGAPGGDKDEACARAGLDKVAAELR